MPGDATWPGPGAVATVDPGLFFPMGQVGARMVGEAMWGISN